MRERLYGRLCNVEPFGGFATSVVDFLVQETVVGFLFSIGSVGSLLGAILYQHALKNHPFRNLCQWTRVLFGLSGMLDLVLVQRLNLRLGRARLHIRSGRRRGVTDDRETKLDASTRAQLETVPQCHQEHFFSLMSIDNAGLLSLSWLGGILLHILKVTTTQFGNLWLAILIKNIFQIFPLCLLFLIPDVDPNSSILPTKMLNSEDGAETLEEENEKLVSIMSKSHDNI